jgi:hypothetical protein
MSRWSDGERIAAFGLKGTHIRIFVTRFRVPKAARKVIFV